MAKDKGVTARRQARVRRWLRAHAYGRPRLTVFRSSKQIYCQIIDDGLGRTLAAASSLERANRQGLKSGARVESAKIVGQQLGVDLLKRVQEDVAEVAKVEAFPRLEGRQMVMVIAPK